MFSNYLRGTAEYRIKTNSPESIVNVIKREVPIIRMDIPDNETVCITCLYCCRDKLEERVEKKKGEIVQKKISGFPVLLNRLKYRMGIVGGLVLMAAAVFVSSLFVWEIRIVGNEQLSDETVAEMLSKAGFREGALKKKLDVKDIADTVLINEDSISWIAINLDGTVAYIELKEAVPALPVPRKENVNLVAVTNGIILRVDAHEGGTKVKKGDTVTKGQMLVSAFVDKRTGGSVLRGARGFVWAETERKFKVTVPLEYFEKKYTGNEDKEHVVSFMGINIPFSLPGEIKGKRYDCREREEKIVMWGNIALPVTVKTKTKSEYEEYKVRRTQSRALEIAKQTAKERLDIVSPNFALSGIEEKYIVNNGFLEYDCVFFGVENIAKELEFELS